VAAFCVQSNKGADLGGSGREALVVVPAPAVMEELVAATPREALDLVLPSVELVYPHVRERIIRAKHYRFTDGRVLFYPGYLAHLRRYDPEWLPPSLALAGDYLISPTVEGAVRSGRRAASQLLREW
jgi:protoporphyrinogen oxidase